MRLLIPRTATLLLISAALSAAPAASPIVARYGSVLDSYEMKPLGPGVWAFLAPDSHTPFVSGNSLVVAGETGALVVDTGHMPALTRRMIADIKKLTSVPVKYVVNTHWHFDHLIGNGEYQAAFPGVAIVSTAATRAQIEAQVPGYAATMATQVTAGIAGLRQMVADGKKKDGSALSADDRAFYEAEIHDFEPAVKAIQEMKYAPPTVTFERELTVDLGKRTVRILFLGRGNTAGDAIVHVPDAKVVATGDLVVAPVPYATASFMFDWPETMAKLTAIDATTIVPGHGPLMHDWTYANRVSALVQAITAQATKAVSDGLTLEDARKRIDVASIRQELAGDDPTQRRIFDTFFLPGAIQRAYNEAAFRAEK